MHLAAFTSSATLHRAARCRFGSLQISHEPSGARWSLLTARRSRRGATSSLLLLRCALSASSKGELRERQHPMIQRLADSIEQVWKGELTQLEPYHLPEDLGYVEGRLEGERVLIENTCYQAPAFRKMHMELARVGNAKQASLDILHCVMFPRLQAVDASVPMFGCDIVAGRGAVSAAIVDLSPVNGERRLAADYRRELSAERLVQLRQFGHARDLPPWGKEIFSEFCVFVRPSATLEAQGGVAEEDQFVQLVTETLRVHCRLASRRVGHATADSVAEGVRGQEFYCSKQQENDKTRRVLESAFGRDWAERYISTVLFDKPEQVLERGS